MAFPFPFSSPLTPYDVGLQVCASSVLQEETPGHPEADKEHYYPPNRRYHKLFKFQLSGQTISELQGVFQV